MQTYELTIVLAGKATEARKKSVQEKVKKLVKTGKGKVGKVDDWGEIDFSYPIKKSSSGTFLHFPLELNLESVQLVNEKLKFEEEIVRYLLVKKSS
jgi:small subunit ribosomal protein S6